jgi:hypothetical protein
MMSLLNESSILTVSTYISWSVRSAHEFRGIRKDKGECDPLISFTRSSAYLYGLFFAKTTEWADEPIVVLVVVDGAFEPRRARTRREPYSLW